MRLILLLFLGVFMVGACSGAPKKAQTRWDLYYAKVDTPRAHVVVVPPDGTTVPMAKLIAETVVEHLQEEKISAEVGAGKPDRGRHFVLTGMAEEIVGDPRVKYGRVLRWMLSDASGRLIATHAHGVEGSQKEWDFGDPQLLTAIGMGTAGPVSQMINRETKARVPVDPLRRGLLVDRVTGLSDGDSAVLTGAVADALRQTDVFVTGDPRQAAFRLAGHVEILAAPDGFEDVRIVWSVQSMDRKELGNAVQENRVVQGSLAGRWAELSPAIGKAAAVGVEHVFGVRAGPPPGSDQYPGGAPPRIVLPGQPGRALPPPQ